MVPVPTSLSSGARGGVFPFHAAPWFKAGAGGGGGGSVPAVVTRPSISSAGTAVGATQTATAGTYSNSPTSYVREWRRNGVAISGATALTYNLTSDDQGTRLSFYEKAVNAAGNSGFVRATTGVARPLFFFGDSLIAPAGITSAVQNAMDVEFGSNQFALTNVAESGKNYDTTTPSFEDIAATAVDPFIDSGWGLVISFDYANEFNGLQGPNDHTGTVGRDAIYAFAAARVAAGAFGHIYCTSPYPNGAYGTHSKNGSDAFIASEDIATNYLAHNGLAIADFRDATLTASILANDDIHWTSEVNSLVADKIVAAMVAAGLQGDGGALSIPAAPATNHLRTYSNPGYVYDPVNPLSIPHPAAMGAQAPILHIDSGTGWDLGSFTINGSIAGFPTADGNQNLWAITPSQTTGGLSNGVYHQDWIP